MDQVPDHAAIPLTPVVGVVPIGDFMPNVAGQRRADAGLTHVVMFRLHEHNPEVAHAVRLKLLGLLGKVPSLLDIEVGLDTIHSERSYDLVLIARFADLAGLNAYQDHHAHLEVLAFLRPLTSAAVAVDYQS